MCPPSCYCIVMGACSFRGGLDGVLVQCVVGWIGRWRNGCCTCGAHVPAKDKRGVRANTCKHLQMQATSLKSACLQARVHGRGCACCVYYVCVCALLYVCVCVCVCVYLCVLVCMMCALCVCVVVVCMCAYLCVCVCICVFVCICVYLCVCDNDALTH